MPGDTVEADLSFLELAGLFEEHRAKLLAMLRLRIDPALDCRIGAEAILHETFLVAHQRWDRRPDPEKMSPYGWLKFLARQCLIDAWRRERSRREIPWPEQTSPRPEIGLIAGGSTPSSALRRAEVRDLVHQVVESLEPIDREIIQLIKFEARSPREAAEILGIKVNAANARLFRALKQFRALMPESLKAEDI